jgi:hypothetical protein
LFLIASITERDGDEGIRTKKNLVVSVLSVGLGGRGKAWGDQGLVSARETQGQAWVIESRGWSGFGIGPRDTGTGVGD